MAKPEVDYAAIIQWLRQRRQQVLSEEYGPAYVRHSRCQNQLCRDVSADEAQERAKEFQRADFRVKQLLIAEQVMRDEFGPAAEREEE
jgi:hypothetical protein